MSTKLSIDMSVTECRRLSPVYSLLRMSPADGRPIDTGIAPGTFAQILIPGAQSVMLRRPISICFVDSSNSEIWLLVRVAGNGTRVLANSVRGDIYNMILPLGHGFSVPTDTSRQILLVGGGVGVAPLLYYAKCLNDAGIRPTIALGARSAGDLLLKDEFERFGDVHVSTDDGSYGQQGLIIANAVFDNQYDMVACCGPTPMMKAVASLASTRGWDCEVSLENHMACGLGACLCCVEDTVDGNVCVCTEGPVFNINSLKWNH